MDDLTAFLRAQWDAEEADALAAIQGTWEIIGSDRPYPTYPGEQVTPGAGFAITSKLPAAGDVAAEMTRTNAAHIARHDPARVLADVEAKRRMLEAHNRPHHCAHLTGRGESSVVDGKPWALYEEPHTQDTGDLCDVLRLLALPYADADGYREDWKP